MTTFHMPGSFHNEASSRPTIFRPPTSPSNSGYISSTTPAPSYETVTKRKRKAGEKDAPMYAGGFVSSPRFGDRSPQIPADRNCKEAKYALAGQINTPGAVISDSEILGESAYSESDFRKVLGPKRVRDEMDTDVLGSTPLFNLPTEQGQAKGWGSTALGTLGGVMGKLWQFCTTSAFKGFSAGGGSGFHVNPSGAVEEVMFTGGTHRFPGCYPDAAAAAAEISVVQAEEDGYEFESRASTPTGPSAKRRQTESQDDLGRNWIMVQEPRASTPKRHSKPSNPSPRNRNQGPSLATRRRIDTSNSRTSTATATATPTPRRSTASRPSFIQTAPSQPPFTSHASYASSRSPSPSKYPSSQPQPSGFQPGHSYRKSNGVSRPSTPSLSHRRTTSNASTASPLSPASHMHSWPSPITQASRTSTNHSRNPSHLTRASVGGSSSSPRLDAEAKKLAAKRQRQEKKTDVQKDEFNQRLQDMIRQGKEALGTRVEVDEDDGWDDE